MKSRLAQLWAPQVSVCQILSSFPMCILLVANACDDLQSQDRAAPSEVNGMNRRETSKDGSASNVTSESVGGCADVPRGLLVTLPHSRFNK